MTGVIAARDIQFAVENGVNSDSPNAIAAFGFVWLAGILLSFITARLAISGALWDLGFPVWLIWLIVLVGLWQWIWLGPLIRLARRRQRLGLSRGLLRGGLSFSVVQGAAWALLFFVLRHLNVH